MPDSAKELPGNFGGDWGLKLWLVLSSIGIIFCSAANLTIPFFFTKNHLIFPRPVGKI